MTNEEIQTFENLSNRICKILSKKNKCRECPFYSQDGYYGCNGTLSKEAIKILLEKKKDD